MSVQNKKKSAHGLFANKWEKIYPYFFSNFMEIISLQS